MTRALALCLLLALVACEHGVIRPAEKLGPENWLKVLRSACIDGEVCINVVCDTVTGDVLYLSSRGGMAVASCGADVGCCEAPAEAPR